MTDKRFELTRRNALLGLGTIGVASIGAGAGTSAYFSDQEEFTDNTIQAGEFGLTVKQQINEIDQDGIGPDELYYDTKDGGVYGTDTIEITDAKPGDEYTFCWEITVRDNPGYVAIAGDFTDEDGYQAGNVDAEDLSGVDSNSDLVTVGEATEVRSVTLSNGDEVSYEYDTLEDLLADLEDGVLLEDEYGEPIEFEPGTKWTLCVELEIPTSVGNELQGAELVWNKTFYAEQKRHNDDLDAFVDRAVDAHED